MNNRQPERVHCKLYTAIVVLLFSMLSSSVAHATWSIIAVDRDTGEIGIAGASCTFDVSDIASIVPGKGAIVVQAASNYFARMKGVDLMEKSAGAEQVLAGMMHSEFDPERQQYGVITLDSGTTPQVYSGKQIKEYSGSRIGDTMAVMGNILVSEVVIADAFDAFTKHKQQTLSERLMLALTAGADAGGDTRCGSQHARSAFLMVYNPAEGAITKLAIQGIAPGGQSAIVLLNAEFDNSRTD